MLLHSTLLSVREKSTFGRMFILPATVGSFLIASGVGQKPAMNSLGYPSEQKGVSEIEYCDGVLIEFGVNIMPADVPVRAFKVAIEGQQIKCQQFSHAPFPLRSTFPTGRLRT